MDVTEQALQHTHDVIEQIVGRAVLALHRQGQYIQTANLLAYLAGEQEREPDPARRFFIGVAIGLLAV
ncbi:hypothetical protein [Martelella alba]|uniref:Uncharacterized protein n=1 Tax=Martelella alba TaxID=2590451 RepID=A0ABY2STE2_9HYPH|nr:hypothetical protein [Martelella alba]TKI08273.1 hypothetical protein FCN80_03765 [Martelella alba]